MAAGPFLPRIMAVPKPPLICFLNDLCISGCWSLLWSSKWAGLPYYHQWYNRTYKSKWVLIFLVCQKKPYIHPNTSNNKRILLHALGSMGYSAKWNMSDRERQILYDLTYMWILPKNELIRNREHRWGLGNGEKWMKVVKRYKLPVIRLISSGTVTYIMVTIVNNIAL